MSDIEPTANEAPDEQRRDPNFVRLRENTEDLTPVEKEQWKALPDDILITMNKRDLDLLLGASFSIASTNYNIISALYNTIPLLRALDNNQANVVGSFINKALTHNHATLRATNRLLRGIMRKANGSGK